MTCPGCFRSCRNASKDLREAFFNGDATMMIALFDNTTSSETSMEAVTQIRKITSKNCFVSGMTGIVTDIKQIALKEMPIYVVIASCLSLIVLLLAMDSLVVPVLFLLCIGVAVLYNLGSNIFLGQISYITQARQQSCSLVLPWIIPFSC